MVIIYEKLLKKYRKLVKASMQSLGVYKLEFDTLIGVYAGLLAQYQIFTQRLIDAEMNVEVETERGGTRKSATATYLEKIRTDLIVYSDRLLISPKALISAKLEVAKKESRLSKFLKELGKGD